MVYKLLQQETVELDMESNRAKANQELPFPGRLSGSTFMCAVTIERSQKKKKCTLYTDMLTPDI